MALDPESEHRLRDGRARETRRLASTARAVELAMAPAFVATAASMAAVDHDGSRPALVLALAGALVLLHRVPFEIGAGWTTPIVLAVIPMLALLPAGIVPAVVAIAMVVGRALDGCRRERHPTRLLLAVNDAWFVVGASAVLLLLGDGPSTIALAAAVCAMPLADLAASLPRARATGAPTRAHAAEVAAAWRVDLLLAPAGLALGLAGDYAFLAALPLAVLLRRFAAERRERLDQALALSETYRRIALLLGDVIGDDDEYTGDHSQGVVEISVEVAEELGLGLHDRQLTELGALLHDVGKIQVPSEIINKPGPLDDDEWAVMRTHTVLGQEMLDRVGGWLHEVGVVVRASHERWDGSGYPDGLAGEDIAMPARIVACADAYSAITTDRSYRAAQSPQAAIEELRRCAGTHFDPRVVEATVAVIERRLAQEQGTSPPALRAAA